MAALHLTLFGGFRARLGSGEAASLPGRKVQALLAYLAITLGQFHPRDKLAALLWSESSDAQARDALRHALAVLRRAMPGTEPLVVVVEGPTLALNPAVVDVDVATFERRVAEGTPEALEQAAALYRGDLLSGLSLNEPLFEEWFLPERERLRELALDTLATLLAHHSKSGATERAIQTAVRLLGLDPLQEVVHRALMRLYVRQSRRGAALKQYQLCVAALRRELGTEPEVETKHLYQEILQRQPVAPPHAPDDARLRAPHCTGPPPLDLPGTDMPLIGREPELARLRRLLDEAERGHGQLVAIAGEAGIGKTSLLGAVAADATARGAHVLLGRCYESASILPFGPWVDAVRSGQILDDGQLVDALTPVWRSELTRLLPELGRAGLPAPSDDQLRLFESVAHLVDRLAARQPLVLMLEDIHWADEMSLRLLAFISRRIPRWHVLLLATAREEELADAPTTRRTLDELGRGPHAAILKLSLLSRPDTALLVRSLSRVGSDAQTLTRLEGQVWAVSEGNPFVAVETIRALQEGSILEGRARLPLARRVHELIAGRLERLSGPDRGQQLIAVAAVIGREFEFVLLQRAAGISEHDAAAGVEELVRRQVLQNMGDHFDFTHERIRAVTYDQIFSPRRVLLHRAVAEAIETLYRGNLEPHYLSVGAHYFEGRVWDKAVAYLQHAANAALERSAYHEALAGFEKALVALGHLTDGPEKNEGAADLHSQIQRALYPLGDDQAIIEHLRQAEALATTLGDQRRLAKALSRIAQYHWQMGEPDEGIEIGDRALAIAEALGEVGLVIKISEYLGQIHRDRGDAARAKEIFAQYVDRFDGDRRRERFEGVGYPAVSFLANLASCHALLGEFAEGIARGAQALRLAEEIDHPFTIDNACRWFAHVYLLKGDLDAAVPLLERALEFTRARGQGEVAARARARLGYALALSGQVDEAVTMLEDLRSPAMGKGRSLWPLTNIWLAEAYVLAGRLDDAQVEARRALALAGHQKARGNEAWALLVLGEIASRREPPDAERAGEHCKLALALAGELRMRPLVARYHLALGGLYQRTGARAAAASHLANAADMFRRMDMIFWLRKVEPLLGRLPGPPFVVGR